MSDFILKVKDSLLDKIENRDNRLLTFPLARTNKVINGYVRGEFIIVGGRKTSGKSSFVLSNYIINPMLEKFVHKTALDLKMIYFNTKSSLSEVMEKITVTYNAMNKKDSLINNKISIASLYNYPGASKKIPEKEAKKIINNSFNVFDAFLKKKYLDIFTGTQTIESIDAIIRNVFSEYGYFDDSGDTFEYIEKYKSMIPIIVIDDASMILGERFLGCIKNDNAFKLGIVLKKLAKMLNAIIVLNVPSSFIYERDTIKYYINKLGEIAPYHIFADKVLFLHNPFETNDKYYGEYETENFINKKGICYLRMMSVSANSTGATNVQLPYFFFPESGTFLELPTPDKVFELESFYDIVHDRKFKPPESKDDEDDDKNED